MASDEIRAFWNAGAKSERDRVLLRIATGTKATSPAERSKRRENPLFYFNPLPDNSSGSKIRPFQCSKDESGRPNAMMRVMANQQMGLRGGVLEDYRYARSVLDRRARDTTNIQMESEGLPPNPEPIAELSAVESKNLELNTLLQNIVGQIASGTASQLTVNDLKGIPRLLVGLLPTYTPQEGVELKQFIDDDILEDLRGFTDTSQKKVQDRLLAFFEACSLFIDKMMPFLGLDDMTKKRASLTLGKKIFGKKLAKDFKVELEDSPPSALAVAEEEDEGDDGGDDDEEEAPPRRGPIPPPLARRRPQVAPDARRDEEEEDEEEEDEEEEAQPGPRFIASKQLMDLRKAYRNYDTDTLEEYIRENIPRKKADKYFKSRTTMANLILSEKGLNIK